MHTVRYSRVSVKFCAAGAYGLDIGSSLTQLLRRLLQRPLPEEVMLRVGMGNPPFLLGQLAAATDILGHPNVFEFLHLPVQSGSNSVLSRMVRIHSSVLRDNQ